MNAPYEMIFVVDVSILYQFTYYLECSQMRHREATVARELGH